jgi:hypothetical protein
MARELPIVNLYLETLRADHRVGELYQARNRKVARRAYAHAPVAVFDLDPLEHAQELARRFKLGCSRLLYEIDERFGAAVKYRHFERVNVNDAVIDVGAGERREQVLDCRDHHTLAHKRGRVAHARDMLRRGCHLEIIQVGSAKYVSRVGGRRPERYAGPLAGVKAVPGG